MQRAASAAVIRPPQTADNLEQTNKKRKIRPDLSISDDDAPRRASMVTQQESRGKKFEGIGPIAQKAGETDWEFSSPLNKPFGSSHGSLILDTTQGDQTGLTSMQQGRMIFGKRKDLVSFHSAYDELFYHPL